MKLISVRSVFVLILIWTIGVVFYMTSKYLCCLFNSQLFLKYRESSKAGQKSQYQFFDNEENYVDDSLNYQCNSTMVSSIFYVFNVLPKKKISISLLFSIVLCLVKFFLSEYNFFTHVMHL